MKKQKKDNEVSSDLLNILACPACKGHISRKKGFLYCAKCKSQYKVVRGVPYMLIQK
ncbi:MAG: Trm112 family protein [archaeon]